MMFYFQSSKNSLSLIKHYYLISKIECIAKAEVRREKTYVHLCFLLGGVRFMTVYLSVCLLTCWEDYINIPPVPKTSKMHNVINSYQQQIINVTTNF